MHRNPFRRMVLLAIVTIVPAGCANCWSTGTSNTGCGIALPATDNVQPVAAISIEYNNAPGETHLFTLTHDATFQVPRTGTFDVFYSGKDEGGIKTLILAYSHTNTVGGHEEPLVTPDDFTRKCTNEFAFRKFHGSDLGSYIFDGIAEDYAGNRGTSFRLTVVPKP